MDTFDILGIKFTHSINIRDQNSNLSIFLYIVYE